MQCDILCIDICGFPFSIVYSLEYIYIHIYKCIDCYVYMYTNSIRNILISFFEIFRNTFDISFVGIEATTTWLKATRALLSDPRYLTVNKQFTPNVSEN